MRNFIISLLFSVALFSCGDVFSASFSATTNDFFRPGTNGGNPWAYNYTVNVSYVSPQDGAVLGSTTSYGNVIYLVGEDAPGARQFATTTGAAPSGSGATVGQISYSLIPGRTVWLRGGVISVRQDTGAVWSNVVQWDAWQRVAIVPYPPDAPQPPAANVTFSLVNGQTHNEAGIYNYSISYANLFWANIYTVKRSVYIARKNAEGNWTVISTVAVGSDSVNNGSRIISAKAGDYIIFDEDNPMTINGEMVEIGQLPGIPPPEDPGEGGGTDPGEGGGGTDPGEGGGGTDPGEGGGGTDPGEGGGGTDPGEGGGGTDPGEGGGGTDPGEGGGGGGGTEPPGGGGGGGGGTEPPGGGGGGGGGTEPPGGGGGTEPGENYHPDLSAIKEAIEEQTKKDEEFRKKITEGPMTLPDLPVGFDLASRAAADEAGAQTYSPGLGVTDMGAVQTVDDDVSASWILTLPGGLTMDFHPVHQLQKYPGPLAWCRTSCQLILAFIMLATLFRKMQRAQMQLQMQSEATGQTAVSASIVIAGIHSTTPAALVKVAIYIATGIAFMGTIWGLCASRGITPGIGSRLFADGISAVAWQVCDMAVPMDMLCSCAVTILFLEFAIWAAGLAASYFLKATSTI